MEPAHQISHLSSTPWASSNSCPLSWWCCPTTINGTQTQMETCFVAGRNHKVAVELLMLWLEEIWECWLHQFFLSPLAEPKMRPGNFVYSWKDPSNTAHYHSYSQYRESEYNRNCPQFSSVTQSCLTLQSHGLQHTRFPICHQLLELPQTHVHRVGDAIQSSHPLSSPSPPASNPSHHQSFPMSQLFTSDGQSIGTSVSVRPMNTQGWFLWSPCSSRDSEESSPVPQVKSINSSVLSFFPSPTLTSTHDHWKNHSLD